MPSTPYAKLLVSVNGGGPVDGGIDVPSAAVIQFEFESVVSWLRARVELYDYPEGWPTPAGWTLAASGTIFWDWTGTNPPAITLPANTDLSADGLGLWGVWMPRLLVNEQLDDDQNVLEGLLDQDVTALCMLSPGGLRDSGAREKQHFTTATTRVKGWNRSRQRNLRALENPKITASTPNATPVVLRSYPLSNTQNCAIRAIVRCQSADGTKHAEFEVKGGYKKLAGTITQNYAQTINVIDRTDAGLDVALVINPGVSVDLTITGLAGTPMDWKAQEAFF